MGSKKWHPSPPICCCRGRGSRRSDASSSSGSSSIESSPSTKTEKVKICERVSKSSSPDYKRVKNVLNMRESRRNIPGHGGSGGVGTGLKYAWKRGWGIYERASRALVSGIVELCVCVCARVRVCACACVCVCVGARVSVWKGRFHILDFVVHFAFLFFNYHWEPPVVMIVPVAPL